MILDVESTLYYLIYGSVLVYKLYMKFIIRGLEIRLTGP